MQGKGAGVRKSLLFGLRKIISTVLSLLILSLLCTPPQSTWSRPRDTDRDINRQTERQTDKYTDYQSINQSINQSIETNLHSAIRRERTRGAL